MCLVAQDQQAEHRKITRLQQGDLQRERQQAHARGCSEYVVMRAQSVGSAGEAIATGGRSTHQLLDRFVLAAEGMLDEAQRARKHVIRVNLV